MPPRYHRVVLAILLICAFAASPANLSAQDRPLVPDPPTLMPAVREAIMADWLTAEERSQLRVFHGVWDESDLNTPGRAATVALNAWDFSDPALANEATDPSIRAEALLLQGEPEAALKLLDAAVAEGQPTYRAARVRAEAHEALGQFEQALDLMAGPIRNMLRERIENPAELTEGVRLLVIRARIAGQPARDFQTMISLLARVHQELDRLHWPARLVEAQLLADKDNEQDAITALHEVLALNPRCAEAWYELGRLALQRFAFDAAAQVADTLRRLNPGHPLATLLLTESMLIQNDPEGAREELAPLLERYPTMRPALAYHAATEALMYDESAMRGALAEYDKLAPASPQAYFIVGRHLAFNRQYGLAAEILNEAVRRQPEWPAPQLELAFLELQSGRDDEALRALRRVAELDPFNKRAANSLFLFEELAEYETIESPHFVVRYRPGSDQVLAEMMPAELERIHSVVAQRFQHEPARKTVIELMPDHRRFSVRITGMPWIHTIAACTGPVIAMEVPREGASHEHLGTFWWPNVLQHEYTHTITLSQTQNRIPHWFTEAAAVSMEMGPRTYDRCQMLADAWREDLLFDLDEINWAFVRPRRPGDRALAYAQGHWMLEYMNERFGDSAVIQLMNRYFQGAREAAAMPEVLGMPRAQFFEEFKQWAGEQVRGWGLDAQPTLEALTDELRRENEQLAKSLRASVQARLNAIVSTLTERVGQPADRKAQEITARDWPEIVRPPVEPSDQKLAEWRGEYPNHPDLLEMEIRRKIDRGVDDEALRPLLVRYAELRPVDPFPHRQLARIELESDDPTRAISHLQELAIREEKSPVFVVELAKLYRRRGELDRALQSATTALHINPYHAANRELAAAIAFEAGKLDVARRHVHALTLIEPDREQHQRRLERLDALLADQG
jgi:tetratricopeptide (TPR) repeat protein